MKSGKFARALGAAIGLASMMAVPLAGQEAAKPAIKTGPEKGQTVPRIEAPDQNGRMQTLASVAGAKGALVVFYRSADW